MTPPSTPASRENDFARARTARERRTRDPLGKAALFSAPDAPSVGTADTGADAHTDSETHGRGATQLFSRPEAGLGTLMVDCAACGRRTRVTYSEWAALHLPVWLWMPVPGRTHRHWLRCPACRRFAWLRARWME